MSVRSYLKARVRQFLGIEAETDFFSQAGEDAIVWNVFSYLARKETGTYVDIGAYHPVKYSNTYLLYKAGWRGINVDPRPGFKELFDRARPGDTNIEAGVGSSNGSLKYYFISEDSTLNSFSKENLERLRVFDQVTKTIEIPVYSLGTLFDRCGFSGSIDYLNVDAEGFEMEILHGISSLPSLPTLISVEQNGVTTLGEVLKSEPASFLESIGYEAIAKNVVVKDVATVFYFQKKTTGK